MPKPLGYYMKEIKLEMHDDDLMREHAEYLARSIPKAEFVYLPEVSHFAPLQRPELFNGAMLTFLGKVLA